MTTISTGPLIAVFEPSPYWGPELQRQFAHAPIVIRECRSVDDLLPLTAGYDSALFVINFDAAIEDCLAWLGSHVKSHSVRWPVIACGSGATSEYEWLLREAGVTAFLPDEIPGDSFARLCRWQLGLQRPRKTSR